MDEEQKLYYQDPHSLLVVSQLGQIKKLYTPFPVLCRISGLHLNAGDTVMVSRVEEQIEEDRSRVIIFVVDDKRILHRYFMIL